MGRGLLLPPVLLKEDTMRTKKCSNCKHYTPTGTEHSDLESGWEYIVGTCAASKQKLIAEWRNCYLWEKRKCGKQS